MSAPGPLIVTQRRKAACDGCSEDARVPLPCVCERDGGPVVYREAFATLETALATVKQIVKCAPCPDDDAHRALRALNLTVADCEGSGCQQKREHVAIASSRFGDEGKPALDAVRAGSEREKLRAAIDALSKSGGKLTLPNGDVIEVETMTWEALWEQIATRPRPASPAPGFCEKTLAAWNAEHGIGIGFEIGGLTKRRAESATGYPIDQWDGLCDLTSRALAPLLGGIVRRGQFVGSTVEGAYFHGSTGDHSWIELPDGRVCDPTRHAFDLSPRWPLWVGNDADYEITEAGIGIGARA